MNSDAAANGFVWLTGSRLSLVDHYIWTSPALSLSVCYRSARAPLLHPELRNKPERFFPPPLYKNDNRFKPDLSQSTKTKNEDKVWRWVWTMQDHKWFSMFLFQEAHNEAQCFHLFYSSSGVTVMYWKTKMFPNIRPTINHMRGSSSSNFSIVFAIWARTVPLLMLTGPTYDRRGPKQTNLVGYEDVSTL